MPKASDLVRRLTVAVREDRAADATAALLVEDLNETGEDVSALHAATVLLGIKTIPKPIEAHSLALLFREPDRLDLCRVGILIANIANAPTEEMPRVELAAQLAHAGESYWAERVLLPVYDQEASPLLHRVISGVSAMIGRSQFALAAGADACAGAPHIAEYHLHHAGLLLNAAEPGLALLAAGRAIGLEPGNAIAWRFASSAYLALGLTAEAIEASRRAAALAEDQAGFAEEVLVFAAAESLNRTEAQRPHAAPPAPAAPRGARAAWAELRPLPPATPARLRDLLRAKLRVLDALILREARGLFTHSRLGYAWALFEPLTHVFILTVAMIFLAGPDTKPIIGDSMAEFYMTGVLPYLVFCHLTEQGMDLARSQRVVLTLPGIQLGDVLLSSLLLRMTTDTVVIVISLAIFVATGLGRVPRDLLEFVLAFVAVFLFGFGIAGINLALSMLGTVPERIWPIILRAAYFLSGIFYHPAAMPAALRDAVLWNPLIHLIEWVRQAYYPAYTSPFLDIDYLMRVTVVALLLGTLAAASVSRQVRLHR